MLCSSVRELLPIVRLDDVPVADGAVGPEVVRLRALYRTEVVAQTAG
jgi:branched-subunit amino acid aminotransferase/4-amino-4-deoxychorismate lyase